MIPTARYWDPAGEGEVICRLCPHQCRIPEGGRGLCRHRVHRDGQLLAEGYGRTSALHLDPIEKKPLYHFLPGQPILSIGGVGCNLRCSFCQNWSISQAGRDTRQVQPEELLLEAVQQGSRGVAFTYAEPMVWFEFILDCARLLREAGLVTVLVTNGTIQPEPLDELLAVTDAMNIDLKAIRPEFYREHCHGFLETVLETIRTAAGRCHLELTNLLIPGLNDDPGEIRQLVEFVASVDPAIPLHFSRYFPHYRMKRPATPLDRLQQAYEIGRERLDFVYLGNVAGWQTGSTWCPGCGELLICRDGYRTDCHLDRPACPSCGRAVPVVMETP